MIDKGQINKKTSNQNNILDISEVRFLNPKLDRKLRQSSMKNWLTPFGFISGVIFVKMTNLSTFAKFGFNELGEILIGGILGMISGFIGSFFAAMSVNNDRQKEIRELINLNNNSQWFLLIETPFGIEIPWESVTDPQPNDTYIISE